MLGELSRRDRIVLAVIWSAAFGLAVMMGLRGVASDVAMVAFGLIAFGLLLSFSLREAKEAGSAPEEKEAGSAASAEAAAPARPAAEAAAPTSPAAAAAPVNVVAERASAPVDGMAAPNAVDAPGARGDAGKPELLDAPRAGGGDDLKLIKGVGPKLEAMLNRMGIHHFDQIAGWTGEEVAWVDDNLEGFRGRVSRDGWVDQARVLASGGATEFSERAAKGDVPTSRA
ncbi:NADH:ubiquinone oxidoreductase [Rubrimonas cliftonensis]|uniref:NADH-quinone oxidoreductase subunit E n=1 Tax=Rubrimonas cliftonensis TaxID=89524 RepID=A0A1H3ZEM7_9RHOB|nr:NADH:ubiquinone oxidoreductase [Rubrimonas cliftonensis]SEA21762.1 NADH-quinone oxidoreductase subunit E [Rubrimonas cliftonensis]